MINLFICIASATDFPNKVYLGTTQGENKNKRDLHRSETQKLKIRVIVASCSACEQTNKQANKKQINKIKQATNHKANNTLHVQLQFNAMRRF